MVTLLPKMATLRNNRKLAAMARETQKYPRNNQSQSSSAPGITEEYIAQVSEEIEGRVTKKLSQEFSRTESRILGALPMLDEFLLNPQIRTFSGTVPGTSRNANVENQEPSGDRSQNDPHPEVEFSACRASNLTDSDRDETSHSVAVAVVFSKGNAKFSAKFLDQGSKLIHILQRTNLWLLQSLDI